MSSDHLLFNCITIKIGKHKFNFYSSLSRSGRKRGKTARNRTKNFNLVSDLQSLGTFSFYVLCVDGDPYTGKLELKLLKTG